MKQLNTINLGSFKVSSGKLIVSDPCYTRGVWCMGFLEDVKKGKWNALIQKGTSFSLIKNEILVVAHESTNLKYVDDFPWEKADFKVGVDSGQAGIFDNSLYPQEETGDYGDEDSFYGKCCITTLDKSEQAGVIDEEGVVSRSGFGDGSYDCFVAKSGGEVVAVKIVFIPENEEEEDSDDDWEDDDYDPDEEDPEEGPWDDDEDLDVEDDNEAFEHGVWDLKEPPA